MKTNLINFLSKTINEIRNHGDISDKDNYIIYIIREINNIFNAPNFIQNRTNDYFDTKKLYKLNNCTFDFLFGLNVSNTGNAHLSMSAFFTNI